MGVQLLILDFNDISESLIRTRYKYIVGRGKVKMKEYEPHCERCKKFIDDCICVCPYCGESSGCICCIGVGKATGG